MDIFICAVSSFLNYCYFNYKVHLIVDAQDGYGSNARFTSTEGIAMSLLKPNLFYIGDTDKIRLLNITNSINRTTTVINSIGQANFFDLVIDSIGRFLYSGSNYYNCIYQIDLKYNLYMIYSGNKSKFIF